MKLIIILATLISVTFSADSTIDHTRTEQTDKTMVAVYDGYNGDGYKFTVENKGKTSKIFKNVLDSVLKRFDLHSKKLIGKKFKLAFIEKKNLVIGKNGLEELITYTITYIETAE